MNGRDGLHTAAQSGYSLVELLVASAVSLILLLAIGALFRPALDISFMLTQQAAILQSGRFATGIITRELAMAGNGLPGGGVQLPQGAGSAASRYGCDPSTCYVSSNTLPGNRLYGLIPGDARGPTVSGIATDAVTVVYRDPASDLDQYALVSVSAAGDQIQFNTATSPAYNDAVAGARVGDALVICNSNGCAAAVVTSVGTNGYVNLANGDPLLFNQSGAAFGNVASIADATVETRAFRLVIATYYIDDTVAEALRLMRQVNANPPRVAALNIENLQLSYDIFHQDSSSVSTNLADAGGAPNQIRKINISLGVRAPVESLFDKGYERMILTTSVSPRSLRFRDSY